MAMGWIKIFVQPKPYINDKGDVVSPPIKETIIADTGLEQSKRVMKDQLIDFYVCDEAGNRIKGASTSRDPKQIAFEALKARAKDMKIPGYAAMSEQTLLKAVQNANNKPALKATA